MWLDIKCRIYVEGSTSVCHSYSSRIRCKSSDVSETAQDSDVVKLIGGSLTTMVYQIAALYFL